MGNNAMKSAFNRLMPAEFGGRIHAEPGGLPMTRIIFALFFVFSSLAITPTVALSAPLELAPDAPDSHVVVSGDTLWGIAARFLKDPYRWPEIWRMNTEQVKNPHRIYPGQVVYLDRSGAVPQLKLGTVKLAPAVRSTTLVQEIPAIPAQAIEPFLAQPLVIDTHSFSNAPRIVATQEDRVFTGTGDKLYASGVDAHVKLWHIYRPGPPLLDPDNNESLGIEAIFLGSARSLGGTSNDVTTLEITGVKQEIGRGDYLIPAHRPEIINYVPHVPPQAVSGRVIALYGGVGEGGRNSIVSISRGARDGLEVGHVLALYRAGATVSNRFEDSQPQTHVLPDERYGLMFIFRVFDRVAYALILEAARPVVPGDRVARP
jgi:hypothetical protein